MGDNANFLGTVKAGGADGTGLVFLAPVGTTLPTNTSAALDAAFIDAGMINEDGVTFKPDRSVKEVKATGSNIVQRVLVTDEKTEFEFAFLETNEVTMAVYAGNSLTDVVADVNGAISTSYGGTTPNRYAMVIHVVDGDKALRLCTPEVEMSGRKERKLASGEIDTRGVTVAAYPNASGISVYEYALVPNLGGV